jgi:phage FluMu gp28-like protein
MSKLVTTPLDLLLPYQRRWFDDAARFKCGIWSRQTGKDFSTAAEMVADLKPRKKADATTWMIAAPSERQSMESLGKCREWAEAWDVAITGIQEDRDGPGTLLKSGSISFGNGSRIIAVPGRPDTVRGMSANLALTEFAFFDDPDATWRAVLPSIINPLRGGEKKVRIISTPNGKTGQGSRFFKIVDENLLNPKADRKQVWSVHKVTIEDAVRDGLPVDIEQLREAIDSAEAFAQECMCEFLDSSAVLLPYDLILLAESPDATIACDPALFARSSALGLSASELYCGIDFGRTSDPTVCWTVERVGPLLITREVLVLRDMPTDQQEQILTSRVGAARLTCLDYTGPGIGLGDYLGRTHGTYAPAEHAFGKLEQVTFTAANKRIMFPRLRRAFEAPTTLRVPIDVDVREDLHAMQQVFSNGQFSYSAARTAAGHSDRCTALALAVRAADSLAGAVFVPRAFRNRRSAAIRARLARHASEEVAA